MFSSSNLPLKDQQKSSSSSTNVKTVKLCHTWVIEDFLTYYDSAGYVTKRSKSKLSRSIESARFKNEHVQLYLQCYPYYQHREPVPGIGYYNFSYFSPRSPRVGFIAERTTNVFFFVYERLKPEKYLAVQLHLVSTNLTRTPICFEVWCLGADGEKVKFMPGQFQGPCTMGSDCFVSKNIMKDKLINDYKLSIYCEVSYVTTATSAAYESDKAPDTNHFEKMAQNFAKLQRKDAENFTDITLLVRGRQFRAHKFWLCAQSPVFEAMFLRHDTKEKQESRVEIPDVDSSVFEKLLDFIYSGKSECVRGREDELLAAAEKYGFEQLKEACVEELCKKLTTATVTDLLVLADTYNASKLKQKAMDYMKIHGQDTIQTMFANNQADQLITAFRHVSASSSNPGTSNQTLNRPR